MGLHLNYELRLPPDTPRDRVATLLASLRERAVATSVERVSPMFDLSIDRGAGRDDGDAGDRHFLGFYAECVGKPLAEDDAPHFSGDSQSALGFVVQPGRGSETATFALMRRRAEVGDAEEWFWWCGCKTQYASIVSDEHLIAVHTALVSILDSAIELGFEVEVRDETGYWESRSTVGLLESVAKMNRIIARFAGGLSDAIGDAHDVRAAIFEHPRFERLEMGMDNDIN